jgi:DNA-binding MarR family transcriptional regulator
MSNAASDSQPSFVDDYLPALLAQASQLLSGEFHRVVVEQGFTVTEWRVLASLAGGRAMSIGELARISVTTQPTVTRVINRFEKQGDVARLDDTNDRRITLVRITPSGSRLVGDLVALARAHEARVLEPFGAQRSAELKQALKKIVALHQLVEPVEAPREMG